MAGTGQPARRWTSIVSLWVALILVVVESLIGTRFVLQLAGATTGNSFVDFIYDITAPLVRPFEGIFDEQTVGDDGIFEPQSLIALIVYPLIALLLGALLRAIDASAPRAKADTWGANARDLYVQLATLHDGLQADAATPVGAQAGLPRLVDETDVQIEEFTTALRALEVNTESDRRSAAVRDVLASLNALRSALRADAAQLANAPPAAAGQPAPAVALPRSGLREALAALDSSLQGFRDSI